MTVPKLNIVVDPTNPEPSIKQILTVIKPEWNLDELIMKDLSIGYLNRNVGCYINEGGDGVFIRMINAGIRPEFLDTYKKVSVFLHEQNLSPKLLALFDNGICSELVVGESLSFDTRLQLQDEDKSRAVMRALAKFHTRKILEAAEQAGIHDMNDETTAAERIAKTAQLWNHFVQNPDVPQSVKDQLPTTEGMLKELPVLKKLMGDSEHERAFTHMDTNASNIIITPDGEAVLVDYDLTGIGYASVDLAGFFHGFIHIKNPNLADYPSDDFRRKMIRHYLEERQRLEGTDPVTEGRVEKLCQQVDMARLTVVYRYIFAGPFLNMHSQEKKRSDTLYSTSITYFQEYKRLKFEHGLF